MREFFDRRRAARIACDLSVEYKFRGGSLRGCRISNLGMYGLLLTAHGTNPPVGADLLLRLYLPRTNRPVQVIGTVRWTTEETAGVEFTGLSHQAQDEIWNYYRRESTRAA
jgi:hypothetical protein